MTDPWQDRTIALAAVFQAARLAQQLAREGRADRKALRASVMSLFVRDAPGTAEIFGGVDGVRLGLELLRDRLRNTTAPLDFELARYAVSLLRLERALSDNDAMQEAVGEGLKAIESQMKFFETANATSDPIGEAATGPSLARGPRLDPIGEATEESDDVHPRLTDKLGELYQQTLSTATPRIIVNGEHGHLANPVVGARVRAALFSGVRAARLWRQLGGRRWQLLLFRNRMVAAARALLGT